MGCKCCCKCGNEKDAKRIEEILDNPHVSCIRSLDNSVYGRKTFIVEIDDGNAVFIEEEVMVRLAKNRYIVQEIHITSEQGMSTIFLVKF